MNFAHKKHILIIVKFIVTMALLLLIAQNVELQRIFTILDDFDTVFFLLAVVILLLQTMIATIRWRIVLSKIDLLVVPSIREPLGNVCLEAGLCKVAVIASSVDGIPEIIDDNVSGKLIVPREKLDERCFSEESIAFPEVVYFPDCKKIDTPLQVDFKELSGEIIRLMGDDNLRNFYADNLNMRVIKYFNIDRYVSELHSLYRSLL
jgi:glycosyltransferase involved in cell wall biosynthesis